MSPVPVIGLPADRKFIAPHHYHCAGEKYLAAVVDTLDAIPLVIPALAQRLPLGELVSRLDGLLLTGAYSDIEPRYYGGGAAESGSLSDPQRDATNLALIPLALQARLPILGICRGLQELNVALGGSLHTSVHSAGSFQDHREPQVDSLHEQYAPQHEIVPEAGGVVERLAAGHSLRVNSLHGQGIDRLADGLVVEARAPDGLIEAVRLEDDTRFALAVQWHPEWQVLDNPFYTAIFRHFGEACRERARQRQSATRAE
jgi:putative glutamine amidotransferase